MTHLRFGFAAALLLVFVASPVTAQTGTSVGIGYQALHLPDTWAPIGANFDVAFRRTDAWSILGEFGIAHEGGDDASNSDGFNIFNLGGGARWSARGDGITPFAQLVAGIQISTSETDSDTAFMLQPGAGIHYPLSDRFGVSAQVDYRPVFYREETVQEFRFVVGARWSMR
jgi:opacity protein-like surface antigen